MPQLDKPLEELKQYPGSSPKPEDFDNFWHRALDELAEVDPAPELISSNEIHPPYAEAFDLWFTGVCGARSYLDGARMAVAAMDCRGQGGGLLSIALAAL